MNEMDTIEIKAGTKLRFPKANKRGTVTAVYFRRALCQWNAYATVNLLEGETIRVIQVPLDVMASYFKCGEAEIVDD